MDTIKVNGSVTVGADESLNFEGAPAFELIGGHPARVDNFGSIEVSGGGDKIYGLVLNTPIDALVRNEAGASFRVDGGQDWTIGLSLEGRHSKVVNNGELAVVSESRAEGVTGEHVQLINRGQISAQAGGAFAVSIDHDGSVDNRGTITATSPDGQALAIWIGFEGGARVVNSGTIQASGDILSGTAAAGVVALTGLDLLNTGTITASAGAQGGISQGVLLHLDDRAPQNSHLVNEGVIVGDYAIWEDGSAPEGTTRIENAGELLGALKLGGVDDLVINTGLIQGAVALGGGDDTFQGGRGATTGPIDGEDGDDLLVGGKGGESLTGGAGDDLLRGGKGADVLTGGDGADTFAFRLPDSRAAAADLITDLHAGDVIDLSAIDADAGQAGDQAFVLTGALNGQAGEAALTYDAGADRSTLALDVDGDGKADAVILMAGDQTGFTGFVL